MEDAKVFTLPLRFTVGAEGLIALQDLHRNLDVNVNAWLLLVVAVLIVLLALAEQRHWRRLYVVARTLPRDLGYFYSRSLGALLAWRLQRANHSVVSVVEARARTTPGNVCYLFGDEKWTYKDVDDHSNRVARALQRLGVTQGDVVALVLDNRIEYVCLWLGAAKLGAVTALINRHLTDTPLTHTITTAKSKVVLFGSDFADAVNGVRENLKDVQLYLQFDTNTQQQQQQKQQLRQQQQQQQASWFHNLVPLLDKESAEKPVVNITTGFNDPLMYIYTSGTTGLPKACIISHGRYLVWPVEIMRAGDLRPGRDVFYCPLPLYHAAAGAFACGLALVHGVSVALAAKFSVSGFWDDCAKHGVTGVQFIGETCRFLALAPACPADRKHSVRVFLGNGLTAPVWRRFQDRFAVPKIVELYGSTEGNIWMVNPVGRVGAMGFVPRCVPRCLWPFDVVRVDANTNEPVRDPQTGRCIPCEDGEPGVAVGKIGSHPLLGRFDGYLDREATELKVLKAVFSPGDRYFSSGDLVVVDELGFVYFKDRLGDTYRWKGENVSTAEVESVMTSVLLQQGVGPVAAYGVQVPGHEGRAGMAAIADPERRADLRVLAEQLARKLPAYARPVFLRQAAALPMTGTHKVSKVQLQRQGFDAVPEDEDVFVLVAGSYQPLTEDLLKDLRGNKLRI